MHWWNVILLVLSAVYCVYGALETDSSEAIQRVQRSFPYSVSLYRMLGHDRQLRPYTGVEDELAEIIDGLNNNDDITPRLRRSGEQIKRYACRFKFCRIFDA